MKNVLTLCAIVLLCHFSSYSQDCYSFAGEDSRTCSFQDTLIGSPSGGEWLMICEDFTQAISLNELNDSSVVVTYSECGTYTFEYVVSIDSCFASDTMAVDFENPSIAIFSLEIETELQYQDYDCQENMATSCSSFFQSTGVAPKPIWSFTPQDGSCSSTIYTGAALTNIEPIDSCIADTIVITVENFSGTLPSGPSQNYEQNEIIVLDSNDVVVSNIFLNVFHQSQGSGVSQMMNDCPIPVLCHSLPPECLDTLLDTLVLEIPIHYGGYWTVFDGVSFIELDSSYSFMVDTINYWLNVQPSVENYNASFELKEINPDGDTIFASNNVDLSFQWKEVWGLDTISIVESYIAVRDSCCRGGTRINRPDINIPPIPTYDCPPFTVTFIPRMLTSDPVVICGDSTYVVQVLVSEGISPYFFNGISGTIDSNLFTSDPIPFDSVYFYFEIFDSGECIDMIEGDNCSCLLDGNIPIFDLTITEDCGLEGNGVLLVEHISDGHSPFLYSIGQGGFREDTLFQDLFFGSYNLAVEDSFTCVTNIEFQVEPLEWENLDEIYEEKQLCGLEDIRLELPVPDSSWADYFIQWDDGDTSVFKEINIARTYTATIYVIPTCQQFQVTFEVEDLYFFDEDDIKIPNAFTPNGDGLNDGFAPLIDDRIEVVSYSLSIFNRWGNRVFYSNNHEEIWNTESGDAADVYIWVLDMKVKNCNGEIILVKRSGDLTLII